MGEVIDIKSRVRTASEVDEPKFNFDKDAAVAAARRAKEARERAENNARVIRLYNLTKGK